MRKHWANPSLEKTDECLFCHSIHPMAPTPDFVVYQDDFVAVSHIVEQDGLSYLGHLVLQTKRHARGFAELTDEEAVATGMALTKVSHAVKVETGAENVYVIFFAEVIPHLHVLMTARYPNTPQQYWRMEVGAWPEAPRGDERRVRELCRRLRQDDAPRSQR